MKKCGTFQLFCSPAEPTLCRQIQADAVGEVDDSTDLIHPDDLLEPSFAQAGLSNHSNRNTLFVLNRAGSGEVGQADLIHPDDSKLVSAYCQTAEMYGFSTVYLEAGSGASSPVSLDLIKTAKSSMHCTLIVGGGIRTPEQMKAAADAGADYIVTGTITEEFDDLQLLKERLQSLISVL